MKAAKFYIPFPKQKPMTFDKKPHDKCISCRAENFGLYSAFIYSLQSCLPKFPQ